jgi:hypothetical protein
MAVVASLDVLLAAKTEKFDSGLRRSQGKLREFSAGVTKSAGMMGGLDRALMSSVGRLAGFAAGFLAVNRALSAFNEARERIDRLSKASRVLDVATESLAGLAHHANLSGVSLDQMQTSMLRLSRTTGDAMAGLSEPEKAFEQLGIDVKEFAALRADEKMKVLADKFGGLDSSVEKVRLSMILFGRGGAGMVNALEGGRAAIDESMKAAERAGLTFDEISGKKIEAMNDSMTQMSATWKGLAQTIVVELAPALMTMITDLTQIIELLRQIRFFDDPFAAWSRDMDALNKQLSTGKVRTLKDLQKAVGDDFGKGRLGFNTPSKAAPIDVDSIVGDLDAATQAADAKMAGFLGRLIFNPLKDAAAKAFNFDFDLSGMTSGIEAIQTAFNKATMVEDMTPGAMERGSAEAFSAIAASNSANDPALQTARHTAAIEAGIRELIRQIRDSQIVKRAPF